MATIIDVAKRAGVSFKTVSRVLNGEGNVRPATRRKVLEAVKALDYRVNSAARALRSKDPQLIALVFNNTSRAYGTDLHLGAMLGCRDAGIGLFVHTQMDADSIDKLARRDDVMGFLVGAPQVDDQNLIQILNDSGKPVVRIATQKPIDTSFYISVDEKLAAQVATDHLIKLGHRKIALIGGPETSDSAIRRKEGFLTSLFEAQIEPNVNWQKNGNFDYESGQRITTSYLNSGNRPTALFACNDDMAAGAIAAAYRLNLKLPEDLSIVGFDDSPIASVVYPAITTIRQTTQSMAERAVKIIAQKECQPNTGARQIRAAHELIIRESSSALQSQPA
ncbi:MAG: LacI family DNA-binding transcriptional regulator [Pseudomonadota bacterium]